MSKQILLSALSKHLETCDVPIVGVTEPFYDASITEEIKEHIKYGGYVFFGDVTLEQRQNIEAVFPLCKQIIVIGIPYDSKNNSKNENISQAGYISNMAWTYDYHHLVRDKLDQVKTYLESFWPQVKTLAQVDTGPLIDRHIGYRAGLGSYGKNQNLMNDNYGTEFYIGYLLINEEIIIDDRKNSLPLRSQACNACSACVNACPAGVLGDDYTFKGNKCISYLTQKKACLSVDEMALLGKNVYGCDVCQLVCPQNHRKKEIPSPYKRNTLNAVELETFISSSNKAMMRTYKETGFAWRGAKVLKRNAIIAMGHYKNEKNILFLKEMLNQKNDYLIPAILWALYKSNTEDIKEICQELMTESQNKDIISTCDDILLLLK